MFYAICDCDNCYVSCERVFRPDLKNKPVVVLSNNDGCIIARSKEAKAIGIKGGMPLYQMKQQFPHADIAIFSSNYELYGELTARVMSIIRDACPQMFRYSIDESFCTLPDMTYDELKQWGEQLQRKVLRYTGMPISIGIARTKTLAKVANYFAKKHKGYNHCCVIDNEEKRVAALRLYPIKEVWGIGRRYGAKLESLDIQTAYDFAAHAKSWIRCIFNIVGTRTWAELNGEDCIPDEMPAAKKSICTSRSFSGTLRTYEDIRTHVSNYAAKCAEKLRRQNSVASVVYVYLSTNRFREEQGQYGSSTETTLLTPSNSTQIIVQAAERCLRTLFKEGYQYKKAGVVVMGITSDEAVQANFLDYDSWKRQRLTRLDAVADRLNRTQGQDILRLASQQYPQKDANGKSVSFTDAMQHAYRSKNPTTKWNEILTLK